MIAGIVGLGAALRFATLGSQSYWFDEAQAAHEMHLSLGSMWSAMVVHETNPPLYFVLGWVWVHVFGNGMVGLRSLSAVAGTAAIFIAYLCGSELVSRRAGLVAAALTALSPFMIWYSQEAREYMLLAALCGASLLYFARAWRDPSRQNIVGWAVFSALAVLTHAFAGFLVAPEALWLLYTIRNRGIAVAVGVVAGVQVALLPLLFTHATSRLLGFISSTPLSARIQQVPVAFGLGTLYQSPLVRFGLLGAAALTAALILLLVIGAETWQVRGAGAAGAVAAFVLLIPLVPALFGQDYYIFRALMPAWIPLAVVVGAACAAPRARVAGGVLLAILLATMIYAQVKIDGSWRYQRPNWAGVAKALGTPEGPRAIIAVDGGLATDPLALYLPGVPWRNPSGGDAGTVSEVDVVGHPWESLARPLPPGARLLHAKTVDDFTVDRFSVSPAWSVRDAAARADALLNPVPAGSVVLVQNRSATP